ncbi:MAG: hypothetical protein J6V64_02935 [Burkholderiaceae bacterium]|nr:hypothetical protein [Burkholderiaceae bacterium]
MIYVKSILKAIAVGMAIGLLFYCVSDSLFTACKIGLSGAALVLGYDLRNLFR